MIYMLSIIILLLVLITIVAIFRQRERDVIVNDFDDVDETVTTTTVTTTTTTDNGNAPAQPYQVATVGVIYAYQKAGSDQWYVADPVDKEETPVNANDDYYRDAGGKVWDLQ